MQWIQGRNQVCSQRWATLPNSPQNSIWYIPNKFQLFQKVTRKFHLIHPKQISVVSKSDKKKSSAHFYIFSLPFYVFLLPFYNFFLLFSSFSTFPFFHASLFPFLLFFPSPTVFFHFPSLFPNFPLLYKIPPKLSKGGRLAHLAHS